MRNRRHPLSFALILLSVGAGCSSANTPSASTAACNGNSNTSFVAPATSGGATDNVLPIAVGSTDSTSLCDQNVNIPCTSVTICQPGTQNCQTINNILVDTGSYGLRIFSQAVQQNLCTSLTQVTDSSNNPIAECAQFGIGADWGSVLAADVQLGSEPVIPNLSIQVINSDYAGGAPSYCGTVDTSPSQAGFNGILGVGLLAEDCGSDCVTDGADNPVFWSCQGTTCTPTNLALALQVRNPVPLLPVDTVGGTAYQDNNGEEITLQGVSASGAASVTGSLILGVGSRANNTPVVAPSAGGVNVYPASGATTLDFPYFTTTFNSTTYKGFLDSGSNAFYFEDNSITSCPSDDQYAPGFFCPTSDQSISTSNQSSSGAITATLTISNAHNLVGAQNALVFDNIGGGTSISGLGATFDFGLPFFLGKDIYLVNENGSYSALGGQGPTWAFFSN